MNLLERIEQLPVVAAAEDVLSVVGNAVLGHAPPALRDALNGRWLGHALHPALTDLPIGFWVSSAVADLLGRDGSAQILGAAGCASSIGAAATGLADWRNTEGSDRRLGALHASLNVAALVLEVCALAARGGGRRGVARYLSLSGLSAAGVSAWLGGELVFGRGTMVDHTAFTSGPERWTEALSTDDVEEGATRCAAVDGRSILVSRRDGRFHAVEATCTHAGGPLCEGDVEAGTVTCPWHGSRFDVLGGAVQGGPATFPEPRLETRVQRGKVEVRRPA